MSHRLALLGLGWLATLACADEPALGNTDTQSDSDTRGSESDESTATSDTLDTGSETGPLDTETGESETETESETGDDPGPIYPNPDWMLGEPEDHGLSSDGLEALAAVAEGFDSNCVLIIHEGVLVGEWYWNDYDANTDQPNVFSVTKSFTSALVGIAAGEGLLDIEDSASEYITEWAGTESDVVTIRNLISNDSGRQWDFTVDYLQMTGAADQTQFAIDLSQQHVPGAWWEYNNSAIQTLERVLEVATGEDIEDYAKARLFWPIGASISMGHDGADNPQTYQGISASCRDLARFGYLYLREGQWANQVQVVPAEWIAATVVPSTPLNAAYGYMWWLNVEGHWVKPSAPIREEGDGQLFAGAPDELYAAVGALGQVIVVDPVEGYVFVRLGDATDITDLTGFGKLTALWDAFAAAKL
jgi:CubicO group peptidase (beta-lactamase class C family)